MLAWRETARIQREGITKLPSVDGRENARAESAQLVETGARRKTREEIGPLPTPPPLVGSSFPLFRLAISRVIATI